MLQCDFSCKKCLDSTNKCIQCNIEYYQKENDPLNSGEYIYCYKNPEGYYIDNDIYKKCYETCKKCNMIGNNNFHNCLECNDNFSFKIKNINNYYNCYENCGQYSFDDYENNIHCIFNSNCQNLPTIENKFECSEYDFEEIIDNILNNEINTNEITKEEENKLYNKILQEIEKRFTSKNMTHTS